jgi:2-polyprenyl-3-methyl-5-hydroxy-6-metoxy-1,4-benzoquinol methylase
MTSGVSPHQDEVQSAQRFEFGKNWRQFLRVLDDRRIEAAKTSLREMFEMDRLDGRTFLDVGSGSGLFSLAAVLLGAHVHSFDYDPDSVACTRYLKSQYAPDARWVIEEGSVLDRQFLGGLGRFDLVYSWGVLHHTGSMWQALENVAPLVADRGQLALAIYNDQGPITRRWTAIKRLYNSAPRPLRPLVVLPVVIVREARIMLGDVVHGRDPLEPWRRTSARGMSKWYDWVDWIGGYPFEVAKPEAVFDFFRARDFCLTKLHTEGGSLGCNEFVFRKGHR